MSALHEALLAWMRAHFESVIIAALTTATSAAPTQGISALQTKVTEVMSSLLDIQTLLSTETSDIQKLIAVMQAQSATIATLKTQLDNAAAANDPATINQVSAGLQSNVNALEAALAALSTVVPSPGTARPDGRPDPQAGDVIPPGQPVIS